MCGLFARGVGFVVCCGQLDADVAHAPARRREPQQSAPPSSGGAYCLFIARCVCSKHLLQTGNPACTSQIRVLASSGPAKDPRDNGAGNDVGKICDTVYNACLLLCLALLGPQPQLPYPHLSIKVKAKALIHVGVALRPALD
jgi:hypothetical protein